MPLFKLPTQKRNEDGKTKVLLLTMNPSDGHSLEVPNMIGEICRKCNYAISNSNIQEEKFELMEYSMEFYRYDDLKSLNKMIRDQDSHLHPVLKDEVINMRWADYIIVYYDYYRDH